MTALLAWWRRLHRCSRVAERDCRKRARAELAALDVFANSTAHEEYRPS